MNKLVLTILVMLKLLPYYDPKVISFKELVNVFFASQDPTTPNQQGPDRGSSYRSIAFYKMQQRRKLLKTN
jgi:peptide-methionine (S)-S-oxide reductase